MSFCGAFTQDFPFPCRQRWLREISERGLVEAGEGGRGQKSNGCTAHTENCYSSFWPLRLFPPVSWKVERKKKLIKETIMRQTRKIAPQTHAWKKKKNLLHVDGSEIAQLRNLSCGYVFGTHHILSSAHQHPRLLVASPFCFLCLLVTLPYDFLKIG